jgi:heme/copper-type cytochrome/quinol oxidase subunit 2
MFFVQEQFQIYIDGHGTVTFLFYFIFMIIFAFMMSYLRNKITRRTSETYAKNVYLKVILFFKLVVMMI